MNSQIYEEATHWFVNFRAGDVDAAERARFDAWIRRSPEHLRAYLEITEIWQDASFVGQGTDDLSLNNLVENARTDNVVAFEIPLTSAGEGRGRGTPETAHKPDASGLRPRHIISAVAAMLLVLIGAYFYIQRGTYSTDIGEQRLVRLEDGSTIDLNSRSSIRVRYSEHRRDVELLEGQALFRVAKDAQRPFIVKSDRAQVRAVGTQFDVYRKTTGTTVTVLEGRVAITPSPLPLGEGQGESPTANAGLRLQASALMLAAGEQLTISPQRPLLAQVADVESTIAWTQHKITFERTALSEVVEEFNRYNPRPLVLVTRQLQETRISGTFSSTDPEPLLRFLRQLPNVTVEETDHDIRISTK